MTTRKSPPKRPGPAKGKARDKRPFDKRGAKAHGTKKAGPAPVARQAPAVDTDPGERIAKVMARAGLCSRREAETWIENGRVQLNGKLLETPAITVTANDKVLVDGKPLPTRERTRLWLYHKPRGLVTTNKDPEGRPTVFERLPRELPRVLTVGRLDINTQGLLLLTNDGGLARVLELPSTGWLRRYRVRAYGKVTQADLDGLSDGVAIDGVLYGAIEATLDKEQGDNVWMTVGLREGKNREVKRVLEHLGLSVNRLIRISYGPFQLMDLPERDVREIRGRVLRDQLGDALAEEAGADFDAPIFHQAKPEEDKKPSGQTRAGARGGDRRSSENREGGRRSGPSAGRGKTEGGRRGDSRGGDRERSEGKWLTAREGRTETDRKKAAKSERSDRKQGKRSNAGPRQEKVSPRSRFRMTSEPKPRKEYAEERPSARPRKIWTDDGLVEDKQQQSRQDAKKSDRSGPSSGPRRPRGGDRS